MKTMIVADVRIFKKFRFPIEKTNKWKQIASALRLGYAAELFTAKDARRVAKYLHRFGFGAEQCQIGDKFYVRRTFKRKWSRKAKESKS